MRELAERQGEVVEEVLASLGNFIDLDASDVMSFVLMGEGFGAAEASRLVCIIIFDNRRQLRPQTPSDDGDHMMRLAGALA
jgi:hypothetical protein